MFIRHLLRIVAPFVLIGVTGCCGNGERCTWYDKPDDPSASHLNLESDRIATPSLGPDGPARLGTLQTHSHIIHAYAGGRLVVIGEDNVTAIYDDENQCIRLGQILRGDEDESEVNPWELWRFIADNDRRSFLIDLKGPSPMFLDWAGLEWDGTSLGENVQLYSPASPGPVPK